jgi:cytochrome P450
MQDWFSDPETLECPWKAYETMREEKPIFFSESLGAYIVTRYSDIQKISGDQKLFSSMPADSQEIGDLNYSSHFRHIYAELGVPVQTPTLVRTGGEEHRRYRSLVDRYFSLPVVNRMRPQLAAIVDELIDGFIDAGRVDLHRDFCLKLPLEVMCSLLGLPSDEAERLAASAEAQTRLSTGAIETEARRVELHREQALFHAFLLDLFDRKRKEPDGSILSDLLGDAADTGLPPDDAELCSLISLMNIGGHETTVSGLGNMLHLAFSQPGLEQTLRENPKLVPKFVEEALRLESPVVVMIRTPTEDTEIGGVALPRGKLILLNYAAANRDDRQFTCPDRLDLERKGIRNHLAFGSGVHYCLGASLARAELELAMNRILARMHDIRIDETAQPVVRQARVGVRTLASLPVIFTETAASVADRNSDGL